MNTSQSLTGRSIRASANHLSVNKRAWQLSERKRAEYLAIIKDLEGKFGVSSSAAELEALLLDLTYEKRKRGLEQDFSRTFDELVVFAASSAGQAPQSFARKIRQRKLLDSSIINAMANKSLIDGTYTVSVNLALPRLVHHFFRLLSLRVGVMSEKGFEQIEPKATSGYQATEAKRIVDCFRNNKILDYDGVPCFELQKHQLQFCVIFSEAAERFIVGHELGHVVHWEVGKDHPSLAWGRAWFEMLSKRGAWPETGTFFEGWHREFGADLCGLKFTLERDKDRHSQMVAAGAAEAVLMILRMLEDFDTRDRGLSRTHPPAQTRLNALRACIGGLPPYYHEFGKGFEALLQRITDKL